MFSCMLKVLSCLPLSVVERILLYASWLSIKIHTFLTLSRSCLCAYFSACLTVYISASWIVRQGPRFQLLFSFLVLLKQRMLTLKSCVVFAASV